MDKSNGKGNGTGLPLELPLVDLPSSHPCHLCGACCRYIAVEIDNPTTFKDYDNIHWYLIHQDVTVYIDWEGAWFIEFQTTCDHLTAQKTCGIYDERPGICSDFSWDECEVTTKENGWKYRFETQEGFLLWHRERRPRSFERYREARRKLKQKRSQIRRKSAADTRVTNTSAVEPVDQQALA